MLVFGSALLLIVALLLLEIPVAFAFGLGALVYVVVEGRSIDYMLPQAFWQIGGFALLALPLFIMAGSLMSASGISDRIIAFVNAIVGRIRGGLGAVTVLACMIVGAIAGSGSSAIAAVGTVMIRRMEMQGYDRGYAVSLVACSSVLAQLIPPSVPMIVFALATGIPVTAAFLSTILPGFLIAGLYIALNYRYARLNPHIGAGEPAGDIGGVRRTWTSFRRAFWALLMPVIMLVGIYSGALTPTEAAAVAVVYVIPVGLWIYRGLSFRGLGQAVVESGAITGSIIVILFALAIMSRAMILEQIPQEISHFLLSLSDQRWVLLLLINLILLLIGMLVDDVSGSIVAAVVLWPVAQQLQIHPVHFAAIVGTNLGLGNITPPCAPLLYMAGALGNCRLPDYLRPTMGLLLFGHLPVVLLVTFLPDLALFLPRLLLGM